MEVYFLFCPWLKLLIPIHLILFGRQHGDVCINCSLLFSVEGENLTKYLEMY